VDCDVLYPPVDIRSQPLDKQALILSLGRFDRTKQHLDLVRAFESLARAGLGDWSYRCVGGLDDSVEQQSYFDEVRTAAGTLPIQFRVNPSRAEVESSLGAAQIFWHAMGYGKDDEAEPYYMEHFGIATVEAMAWGGVPVVVNRGGQPEIVRHGIDGFVWDTLEELEHYTRLLMSDDGLRAKMSESARLRAQTFDKQRFVREVAARCKLSLANT
jgi:glycosyltransferase involved in cell wall biosynthesis